MPTHPSARHENRNSQRHWVEDEFRTLDLGDPRRERRLKTQPLADAAAAITAVRRYSQRWQIELFHKILKSGCRIEERQFESAARIRRCLVLDVIIAARILAMSRAGRDEAGAATPASHWLAEHEWKALWSHTHRSATPPGHPGMIVLWRGLQRLHDISTAWQIFTHAHKVAGNA